MVWRYTTVASRCRVLGDATFRAWCTTTSNTASVVLRAAELLAAKPTHQRLVVVEQCAYDTTNTLT
jgi:hypothetical protein